MLTVLLVLFVLDGEVHTFAVDTRGPAECIVMQSKVAEVIPQMLRRKPQFIAAACADVVPLVTAS